MTNRVIRALVVSESALPEYTGLSTHLPDYEKARMVEAVVIKSERFLKKESERGVICADTPALLPAINRKRRPIAYRTLFFTGATNHLLDSGQVDLYEERNCGDGRVLYLVGRESIDDKATWAYVRNERETLLKELLADKSMRAENLSGVRQVSGLDNEGRMRKIFYSILVSGPIERIAKTRLISGYEPYSERLSNDEVLDYVAGRVGKTPAIIKGNKITKTVSIARQTVASVLRQLTPQTLAEIGTFLGGRDHTSIVYCLQKLKRLEEALGFEKPEIENLPMREQVERLTEYFLRILEKRPMQVLEEKIVDIA